MAKNNIRSIRFSDDLALLINQQIGDTFTEKFENLITRCVWELPRKEKELEKIEKEIKEKRQELTELTSRYAKAINTVRGLEQKLNALNNSIFYYSKEWSE